jgi:hypothetical protein
MGGACTAYWRSKKCVQILIGNLEAKKPLGRPKHRWKDNIKIYLGNRVWRCGLDLSDWG